MKTGVVFLFMFLLPTFFFLYAEDGGDAEDVEVELSEFDLDDELDISENSGGDTAASETEENSGNAESDENKKDEKKKEACFEREDILKIVEEEVDRRVKEFSKKPAQSSEEKPSDSKKSPDSSKVERRGFINTSFSKNRIAFIMGDDNLRDNSMYSPSMKISDDKLYDDFANRFTSYDNRGAAATKLTLFHEDEGLIPHVSTRLSISLGIGTNFQRWNFYGPSFYEDGSFVEVMYSNLFDLGLKLYPYNSDAIAIGFFNGLRWGDRTMWPENMTSKEPVPGGQFVLGYGSFSLYSALKTKFQPTRDIMSDEMVEQEVRYAGFFGFSYENKGLRVDLEGTYADKGENPVIADELMENDRDDDIITYGFNLFSEYEYGNFMGEPLGISVYDRGEWITPQYGALGFRFRGEGILLNQRLQNADYLGYEDDTPAEETMTYDFYAYGFAFESSLMIANFRIFGLFSYRSLPFLVFDSPGFTPYETISKRADIQNEVAATVHIDYNWKMMWLGFSYGFKRPGAYKAPGSNTYTVIKDRTNNFAGTTDFSRSREPLPPGENPLNIALYKFHFRTQFSKSLSANVEYGFMQDHNRSKIVNSEDGRSVERDFDDETVKNIHSLIFSFTGRF